MKPPGSQARSAIWADLAVLGVAVVWGASYPVAKGALAYAPFMVLILYRFVVTAVIMTVIARRDLVRASRSDVVVGCGLGAILFAIFVAETAGVGLTSATNAALIISLCTVFTPFLDFSLRKSLPPLGVIAGAVVAVAGVGILAGGLTALALGDVMILAAAVLRAVMVVSTKRLMAGRALNSASLTSLQSLSVAGLALMVLLAQGGTAGIWVDAGIGFWGAVAFLSLFCTVLAFFVQNVAVRRSTPTRVSFLMGTEPLFGVALAWLLLSEPITPLTVLGAGLIVGGTFTGMAFERRAQLAT